MRKIMNYLEKAEGLIIHKNDGELDITSPYGIYRYANPKADIFTYIDKLAASNGILEDSKNWTKDQLDTINDNMSNEDKQILLDMATNFYKDYLKDTPINYIPDEAKLAFFSMYVNSNKLAIKSIQNSILDLRDTGILDFKVCSVIDGVYGYKTENNFKIINNYRNGDGGKMFGYYLETLMLSNMKSAYIELVVRKKRYIKYLRGWKNRMDKLQELK